MANRIRRFRRARKGRSRGRGSRMARQGFWCRKDNSRRTVPSTPRVELETTTGSAFIHVLDSSSPIQAYGIVACFSLPVAVQTARFLLSAFHFARFAWPVGGMLAWRLSADRRYVQVYPSPTASPAPLLRFWRALFLRPWHASD